MTFQVGDMVKVSKITLPGAQDDSWWIGRVGKIKKIEDREIYLHFDFDLFENQGLAKFITNSPGLATFLEDELELYIQDINFLD